MRLIQAKISRISNLLEIITLFSVVDRLNKISFSSFDLARIFLWDYPVNATLNHIWTGQNIIVYSHFPPLKLSKN